MIGRTLSHYRILSEIGRSGMGIVHRDMSSERVRGRKIDHGSDILT